MYFTDGKSGKSNTFVYGNSLEAVPKFIAGSS